MKISITKKENRNQLICLREDGSAVISNLGPSLPFHDIAHFVVEKALGLQKGFYGNIKNGYSIEQLSDKNIIKTLGEESWLAEIVTRALQSLSSEACNIDQFIPMIEQELAHFSIKQHHGLSEQLITNMLSYYTDLVLHWKNIENGGTLVLEF